MKTRNIEPKTQLVQRPLKKELVAQILSLLEIDLNDKWLVKMRLQQVSVDILQQALHYATDYDNKNHMKMSFIKLGAFIDIQNRKKILQNT